MTQDTTLGGLPALLGAAQEVERQRQMGPTGRGGWGRLADSSLHLRLLFDLLI